jgi:hypothetical protein
VSDGSLASLVEEWLVTTLRGTTAFADRDVEVFAGTLSEGGEELVNELMAGRASPYAVVLFEGDRPIELEEGEQAYEPVFAVYVAVKHHRPGMARTGETVGTGEAVVVTYGTNGLRDVIRSAVHDECPAQSAGGFYADRAIFKGTQIVFQRKDTFVMRAEVVIEERPARP